MSAAVSSLRFIRKRTMSWCSPRLRPTSCRATPLRWLDRLRGSHTRIVEDFFVCHLNGLARSRESRRRAELTARKGGRSIRQRAISANSIARRAAASSKARMSALAVTGRRSRQQHEERPVSATGATDGRHESPNQLACLPGSGRRRTKRSLRADQRGPA